MADKIKEARVETPPEVPATHFSEISFILCIALCKVSRTGREDRSCGHKPTGCLEACGVPWLRVERHGRESPRC